MDFDKGEETLRRPARGLTTLQKKASHTMNERAVLELLEMHYASFTKIAPLAASTGHTVPSDTKSWSEILVSLVTGLHGRERQKGSDLADGSDVKAANVWEAIDTPRFNGVLPAGRTTDAAHKPESLAALDDIPFLFLVLWDYGEKSGLPRCRIWVVRPGADSEFRSMAARWYQAKSVGTIRSNNFQLHPPRNRDSDTIRNTYGNLDYPLLFSAVRDEGGYRIDHYDKSALSNGECSLA